MGRENQEIEGTPEFIATFTPCTKDCKSEPVQTLKALLKAVLRSYGFRCISIEQKRVATPMDDIEDMF